MSTISYSANFQYFLLLFEHFPKVTLFSADRYLFTLEKRSFDKQTQVNKCTSV